MECGGHIADMLTVKDMLRTSRSGDLRRLRVWSLPGPDRIRLSVRFPSDLDSLEISRPSKQRSGASDDGNTKHSPREPTAPTAPPNCDTLGDETKKRCKKRCKIKQKYAKDKRLPRIHLLKEKRTKMAIGTRTSRESKTALLVHSVHPTLTSLSVIQGFRVFCVLYDAFESVQR